jgi:hypothetical protein
MIETPRKPSITKSFAVTIRSREVGRLSEESQEVVDQSGSRPSPRFACKEGPDPDR